MALLAPLSACLGDVNIPECVARGINCREMLSTGGAGDDLNPTETGGDSGASGASGGDENAGNGSGGATPLRGGDAGDGGAPPCPDCLISPVAIAPGCAGQRYAATLMFQRGSGPYSWQLTQGPEGWSIAASSDNQAVLHGEEVPEEGVTLTVKVTNAQGLSFTQNFRLQVRNNCWFAVTAPESDGAHLFLFDPLSQRDKTAMLEHDADAYDFEFSPDGNWLAYRYEADADAPHAGSLAVVDLTTMFEREVYFGAAGAITSYAWSPSSEVLAAAFVDGTTSSLGAVRLPAVGSEAPLTSLGVTPANVASPLTWVGERYVVFYGPKGPSFAPDVQAVYYALLGPTGFQAPKETLASALAPVTIAAKADGFFVISPELLSFNGLLNDSYRFEAHPAGSLVSPSGRTTAIVNDQQLLEVRSATAPSIPATSRAGNTCPVLLASSPGFERIACVADVPLAGGGARGEVRFFDASGSDDLPMRTLGGFCDEDLDDTTDGSCLRQLAGYSYGVAQATGTARSFSASGRYFAFARTVADNAYVYWADLQDAAPKLIGSVVLTKWDETQPVSVLSFSPDERFLFVQRGARLAMAEVLTGVSTLVSANLTNAQPCSEELNNPVFCGNPNDKGALQFSADSRALAMRASQRLRVFDLSPFPDTLYTYLFAIPPCGDTCAGDFAFQPLTPP